MVLSKSEMLWLDSEFFPLLPIIRINGIKSNLFIILL